MLRPTIGVQGSGLGAMVVGWDTPVRFVSCQEALNDCLLKAKLMACPHCKLTGTLVGHGWLLTKLSLTVNDDIKSRVASRTRHWYRSSDPMT